MTKAITLPMKKRKIFFEEDEMESQDVQKNLDLSIEQGTASQEEALLNNISSSQIANLNNETVYEEKYVRKNLGLLENLPDNSDESL